MKFTDCLSAVLVVSALACTSRGAEYLVGPGEKYEALSQVCDNLLPGDIVTVTGDISDSVNLTRDGSEDRPITIHGAVSIKDGLLVRPKLRSQGQRIIINCTGNHNLIEGLEIAGGGGVETMGIFHRANNLVVRNCYLHHHGRKAIDSAPEAGDILVEFCEFASNGGGEKRHSIDIWALTENSKAVVRHCYFHDGTGGHFFKSHACKNLVAYNWFEGAYYSAIQIVDNVSHDLGADFALSEDRYPMHSDIVGNVFCQGNSPGNRYSILQLGGEHATSPGTEGDFNVAHNLFVMTRTGGPGVSPGVAMLVHGNVDRVKVYNNAFLEYGVAGCKLYERGTVWEVSRTKDFSDRRGSAEPVLEGSNNWVSVKTSGIPDTFVKTFRGANPRFFDLLNRDYRPRRDSPLAGAGMWPLPKGQVVDLAPEYEPQRGIPADLKPTTRRKVTPPSIGPFEVEE